MKKKHLEIPSFKKGDRIETTIIDMSGEGEGIGKTDAFTWFIKDAVIGDTVRAIVMKCKKNYGYAKLNELISPSKHRIKPQCPISGPCGGCNFQAMDYEAELEFKSNKVWNHLSRIGGFMPEELAEAFVPILGAKEIFRYRNKAQYPIGTDRTGNLIAGFYAGRSHRIIPVEDCLIGAKENRKILEIFLRYMERNGISSYDEERHSGLVRHILIRKAFSTGELLVVPVINGEELPKVQELIRELKEMQQITGICMNINREKTNVILGEITEPIWGKEYIVDSIGEIQFKISPNSFFQVNPAQTLALYEQVLAWADLTGRETVWDLYCGIGSISLFLAKRAKQVYGIEIVERAILDARENAKMNHIANVEFFTGRAEDILPKVYSGEFAVQGDRESIIHPDVIVVDPPRKGCDRACLQTMLDMQPARILYISCDSATLARDLRILCDGGYALKKIRPVDMFPRTVHVETVCLMSRGEGK